jgi:hypothetical protein
MWQGLGRRWRAHCGDSGAGGPQNLRERTVYHRGAINSGSVLVRCTAQGQSLVWAWWFELTTLRSPFELAHSSPMPETLVRLEAQLLRPFDRTFWSKSKVSRPLLRTAAGLVGVRVLYLACVA